VIDHVTAGLAPSLLEASGIDTQVHADSLYVRTYEALSYLNGLKTFLQQTFKSTIQWITDKKAVQQLPQLKGKSEAAVRSILSKFGFMQTKVSNSPARNEEWKHHDNSEVLIHPYGNQTRTEYRSGNNAHVHKKLIVAKDQKVEFNDRGFVSDEPGETHIGIRNPSNLPQIRNRPHGDGDR
jgi:hypothetical protein